MVGAFMWGEAPETVADVLPEAAALAWRVTSDELLELGGHLLDGIKVGAPVRQQEQAGAARLDGLAHAADLVAGEVVGGDVASGASVGARNSSMEARKLRLFIAPPSTSRMAIRSWRRPTKKVLVRQWSCGSAATGR